MPVYKITGTYKRLEEGDFELHVKADDEVEAAAFVHGEWIPEHPADCVTKEILSNIYPQDEINIETVEELAYRCENTIDMFCDGKEG